MRARSRSRSSCSRSLPARRRRCCARPELASRGEPGARRQPVADGARRHPPDEPRRDPDRPTLAVARVAGETAPLLFTCSLSTSHVTWDPREPLQSIPLTSSSTRAPDPAVPHAGLGGGARAHLRARDQRRSRRWFWPAAGGSSRDERRGYDRMTVAPIEVAQRASATADDPARDGLRHPQPHRLYGKNRRDQGRHLEIYRNMVTALIGPSGCGKSTFIRCLNRMNDLVPSAKVDGQVLYHGHDLYGARRRSRVGAPADRHGLPEAEPVPEVDLRQRRLGPARARDEGRTSTTASSRR